MKHILMKLATRRPYTSIPEMGKDVEYNPEKGFWMTNQRPLVLSEEFLNGGQNSKKCDQETGEDQKGE